MNESVIQNIKSGTLGGEVRSNSVLIVTGSLPPEVCGVGEGAVLLAGALAKKGLDVSLFHRTNWSLLRLPSYARQIRACRAEVVNILYPSMGYKKSIVPHLLPLVIGRTKCIVSLHEFSRASLLGKLSSCLFFLFADWVVFTAEYERSLACRFVPWLKRKSNVNLISSQIPIAESRERDIDLAYFGLIDRFKGLDEFISIIEAVQAERKIKVCVIGRIIPGHEEFWKAMQQRLEELGGNVMLDHPAKDVAELLARVRVALLPFPDGVSLRRGSALATMANGALLLTTPSTNDLAEFEGKCLMAHGPEALSKLALEVLARFNAYEEIRLAGQQFAQLRSWDAFAESYLRVIQHLKRSERGRDPSGTPGDADKAL